MGVLLPDDGYVRMQVGLADEAGKALDTREAGHGLSVRTVQRDKTFCAQQIVFADGVRVEVSGDVYSGDFAMEQCGPVKGMVEHILEYLLANKRPGNIEPAPNTLRSLDPCAVADKAVKSVAAFRGARASELDEHRCAWTEKAVVFFGWSDDFGKDPAPFSLAGRETVEREIGEGTCSVSGKHVANGPNDIETATIHVRNPDIAAALWPLLPKA
ncbi:hypothetical protein ACFPM7_03055 [Actinokineospora guangxiensis]|uniref:Uncharacterized protein n=1 Tax=Actinokineospora guangxiensis TaxID=1490288 RepID=A0ABW0EI83_9PSEU